MHVERPRPWRIGSNHPQPQATERPETPRDERSPRRWCASCARRRAPAMMDCKKALEASGGDLEAAIDHLRKQGLKSAAKKASRDDRRGPRLRRDRRRPAARAPGRAGLRDGLPLRDSDKFKAFVEDLELTCSHRAHPTGDRGRRAIRSYAQAMAGRRHRRPRRSRRRWRSSARTPRVSAGHARVENPEGGSWAPTCTTTTSRARSSRRSRPAADAAAATEVLKSLCQHIVVFNPDFACRATRTSPAERRRARACGHRRERRAQEASPRTSARRSSRASSTKFYAELRPRGAALDPRRQAHRAEGAREGARGSRHAVESFQRFEVAPSSSRRELHSGPVPPRAPGVVVEGRADAWPRGSHSWPRIPILSAPPPGTSNMSYQRILLKLSGEALGDPETRATGSDPEAGRRSSREQIARRVEEHRGRGGDRGAAAATSCAAPVLGAPGGHRASADYMGMLATVINALALSDAIEAAGGAETRVLTALEIRQVAEPFVRRRALAHLEKRARGAARRGTGQPLLHDRHRRRVAGHRAGVRGAAEGHQGRRGVRRRSRSRTPKRRALHAS